MFTLNIDEQAVTFAPVVIDARLEDAIALIISVGIASERRYAVGYIDTLSKDVQRRRAHWTTDRAAPDWLSYWIDRVLRKGDWLGLDNELAATYATTPAPPDAGAAGSWLFGQAGGGFSQALTDDEKREQAYIATTKAINDAFARIFQRAPTTLEEDRFRGSGDVNADVQSYYAGEQQRIAAQEAALRAGAEADARIASLRADLNARLAETGDPDNIETVLGPEAADARRVALVKQASVRAVVGDDTATDDSPSFLSLAIGAAMLFLS